MKNIRDVLESNPFSFTKQISIEINTICNNSKIHKSCPIHYMEKEAMSLNIIEKILVELGKYNYNGILSPYSYSEPTIDPRLYIVLDLIRKHIPNSIPYLITNGFFITQTTVKELIERGVRRFQFSGYTSDDYEKLYKIAEEFKNKASFKVKKVFPFNDKLDKRVDRYNITPINIDKPCHAPLEHLLINVKGDVALCCYDWKYINTFGSVKEKSLKEIITSDKVIETYLFLKKGERHRLDICSKCDMVR